MAKEKQEAKQDLSSFMSILIMTIGCLVVLLIINTLVIMSNPSQIRITSIIHTALYVQGGKGKEDGGVPFPHGNKKKDPRYIDVHRNYLVLYPGKIRLWTTDLEKKRNAFEVFLDHVYNHKDKNYIVLLIRPRSAALARKLRKVIRDKGVDLGYELFEANRDVAYDKALKATLGGDK